MKNKATVYILGFMVAAVWGLIIYRLVDAMSGDEDTPGYPAAATQPHKEPLNDYTPLKDTSTLRLNYRDPFAMAAPTKDTAQIPVKDLMTRKPLVSASLHTPVVPKPVMSWNFIRYSGYIRNPHSKKLIAIVSVNGKSLMMSEGESSGDLKLLKNLKDSIKVTYQHKTRFIAISTDAS